MKNKLKQSDEMVTGVAIYYPAFLVYALETMYRSVTTSLINAALKNICMLVLNSMQDRSTG